MNEFGAPTSNIIFNFPIVTARSDFLYPGVNGYFFRLCLLILFRRDKRAPSAVNTDKKSVRRLVVLVQQKKREHGVVNERRPLKELGQFP